MQYTRFTFRQTVVSVAMLNLAYFVVEFTAAWRIGSVSLFADSIDFLEDTSLNLLIVLALILLLPGIATLWMVWRQFMHLVPPEPLTLSIVGLGALLVNVTCAFLLAQHRNHHQSLGKAAFLSARNDAFANVAIMVGGVLTWQLHSAWPDLLVGIAIAAMNADAAHEVWHAARKEKYAARS